MDALYAPIKVKESLSTCEDMDEIEAMWENQRINRRYALVLLTKPQYCSDCLSNTPPRLRLVLLVQRGASVPDLEVAHLALDAARAELPAAADTAAPGDLGQKRVAPTSQPLRGEGPRPAAAFV